jgi:methylated-DNA-[protein]-cysteine S-methyltransferase
MGLRRQLCWKNEFGEWLLVAEGDFLVELLPPLHRSSSNLSTTNIQHDSLLRMTVAQLEEYFAGTRQSFDIPHQLSGTAFQLLVWNELLKIPYGQTWSYGKLAQSIGQPKASRAVGAANSRNPLSILYPCHRVVGADGSLTGYAGGLDCKRNLLNLERQHQYPCDRPKSNVLLFQ